MTICEKCLHAEVCAIRDGHDEGDERALKYCYDFRGWISVEERLPEKDGNYITFTNATGSSKYVIAMRFVTTTVRGKKVRRWEWCGRISPWEVTHWMPLPEPPKMKGDEGHA